MAVASDYPCPFTPSRSIDEYPNSVHLEALSLLLPGPEFPVILIPEVEPVTWAVISHSERWNALGSGMERIQDLTK